MLATGLGLQGLLQGCCGMLSLLGAGSSVLQEVQHSILQAVGGLRLGCGGCLWLQRACLGWLVEQLRSR